MAPSRSADKPELTRSAGSDAMRLGGGRMTNANQRVSIEASNDVGSITNEVCSVQSAAQLSKARAAPTRAQVKAGEPFATATAIDVADL